MKKRETQTEGETDKRTDERERVEREWIDRHIQGGGKKEMYEMVYQERCRS